MLIRSLPVSFLSIFLLTGCQVIRGSQRSVEVSQSALAEAMQAVPGEASVVVNVSVVYEIL